MSLAVALFSGSNASAALLAYEGFDYTAGTSLSNYNGGFGFSSAWGASPGVAVIQSGMSYDSLQVIGNGLYVEGTAGASPNGSVAIFRDLSAARGTDGTTTWLSFLHVRTGAEGGTSGPGGTASYLRPVNLSLFEAGTERLALGEGTRNTGDEDVWGLVVAGSTANAATRWTTDPLDLLSLAVVRIDHGIGNADTAYMWINPTLGPEPDIAVADATTTGNFGFNRLRPFAGNPSTASGNIGAQGLIDEIRIGETWMDVTPVPEPSTWALISLGGLVWLALQRKRRRD
jgi:hypothetical protein